MPLTQQKNDHPYFTKFEKVSHSVGLHWDHINTLMVRRTNQDNISDILRIENGLDFIWDQLQIFKLVFESLHPKVIVVINTPQFFSGKIKIVESGSVMISFGASTLEPTDIMTFQYFLVAC